MRTLTLFIFILFTTLSLQSNAEIQDKMFTHLMQSQPIDQPQYNGIERVIVLSENWIVVVTHNTDKVKQELDRLSKGQYSRDPKKAIKTHWVAAREAAGERKLDRADFYNLKGKVESNYRKGGHPIKLVKWILPVGGEPYPSFVADFAHYSYLQLSKPLVDGHEYTITLGDGRSATFVYDERKTVSPAIEVNQAGYLPDINPKYAYVSLYVPTIGTPEGALPASMTFKVIDAQTGDEVLNGPVKLREKDPRVRNNEKQPLTGTTVYEINLGALKQEGYYYITIPGVGRSWPFRVGEGALGDAFYTAARGLYHQRASTALESPFTEWTRDKCNWGKLYDSPHIPFINNVPAPKNYKPFDVIGRRWQEIKGKLDQQKSYPNLPGGWHDAGDYDRRLQHYTVVFDLLNLYEMKPNSFFDGQLNIPESGNGIPDILDEAEFGLRVWLNSQNTRGDGGVAGAIETIGHPLFCDQNVRWFYSKRTRWSSYLYAAAAAQLAHLVKPFNPALSKAYADSARLAYQFALSSKSVIKGEKEWAAKIPAAENRGTGRKYDYSFGEKWDYNAPYNIAARLQLYRLTKDDTYLKPFDSNKETALDKLLEKELSQAKRGPYARPTFRELDFSPWLYYGVLTTELDGKLPKPLIKKYKEMYINKADELVRLSKEMPYRRSKDRSVYGKMAWGFGTVTNYARALLIGHHITNNNEYRRVASYNLDYTLGANPMGLSWTTGIGWAYPVPIQHGISRDVLTLDEPIPGITIYGPVSQPEGPTPLDMQLLWGMDVGNTVVYFINPNGKYHPKNVPLLRRWMAHPSKLVSQNEFTVFETMSPTIFVLGYLMEEDWMPQNYLIEREPRTRSELFGLWYLP